MILKLYPSFLLKYHDRHVLATLRKVLAPFHVKKSSKYLLYLVFRFLHGSAHPVLIKQRAVENPFQ